MPKSFGEILKMLMERKNISARELSRAVDCPQKTVNEWVGAGSRIPRSPEHLKRLANYFGVSVHFMLYGSEDEKNLLGEILSKTEIHSGLYEITIKKVDPKK